MKRLIFAVSVCLLSLSCFAAPTITLPSELTFQPLLCTPDNSVCTWGSPQIPAHLAGLVNPSYGNPYFADLFELKGSTGSGGVGQESTTVVFMSYYCGDPVNCYLINNGDWFASLAVGAGDHRFIAVLYDDTGPLLVPPVCDPHASDVAFEGGCLTPGAAIAVSNIMTVHNLMPGQPGPPAPPPSPPTGGVCPTTIGFGGTLTDGNNDQWAISSAPAGAVSRNGVSAAGYWASSLVNDCTSIKAQGKDNGYWRRWTGSTWVDTTAP